MPLITKTALITGITGQDGAYLAELLLAKGYTVHGIKRRSSLFNTDRIDHLYQDPHVRDARFILHYGDMTDSSSLMHVVGKVRPDEVYNLAAQSRVAVSFEEPEYTANSDALGTLRLLEAIRILGLERKTRFYQASTSEMFGKVQETPQTETTPFYPPATALTLRTPAPQPEPEAPVAQPVTAAALDPIESAEAEYVRATRDLLAQLDARRGQLPSATLTRLHENMRTIDTALDEIRNALRQAPGNPRLAQLLSATYQKKLELLRRATRVRA